MADALGVADFPEELLDLVVASSGGNALFAKEIVGLRREQKILASKVEAAIGRLDDAIARAEVRSSDNTLRGRTLTR
ncbi:MAG TPA: hypothetical protein EYP98_02705 [Planctomycetes bacterium]|nr:hypothetical protein [Planctomycetota bacterium]